MLALVCGLGVGASHGFACTCGGVHARTAWETAEKEAQISNAIFEATPERFAVQWNLLSSKSGGLVRLDPFGSELASKNWPRMLVTFRVKRVYKGNVGVTVHLWTGLGGGDCGAQYYPGLDYLVYASAANSTEMSASLCSPSGWLGSNFLSTELRYLRKEPPTPRDVHVSGFIYRIPSDVGTPEREQHLKRFAAATGQICGVIIPNNAGDRVRRIAFLPAIGYSPYSYAEVDVGRDGKFCSDRLGPGEYYLYFTQGPSHGVLESASYYPGVVERSKASIVKVEAGQMKSDVVFRAPKQKAHTVRGFICTDDKIAIGEDGVRVILLTPDGRTAYEQTVDFRNFLPLPKTKYFSFENVLPGRYIACGFGPGKGWLTKVVEVNVTSHSELIFLALKRDAKR